MAKQRTMPIKSAQVLRVLQSANGGIVTDRMIKASVWSSTSAPISVEPYARFIRKYLGHNVVRRRNIGYQLLDI